MAETLPLHEHLSLYHSPGCAYCAEVRRVSARLGFRLELRDVRQSPHGDELMLARGRQRVPVLRIDTDGQETRWLPDSLDIVDYLETTAARRDARPARTARHRLRIRLLRMAPIALLALSMLTQGLVKALLLGVAATLAIVRFLPPRSPEQSRRPAKGGSNLP